MAEQRVGRYRLTRKIIPGDSKRGIPDLWQAEDLGDLYYAKLWSKGPGDSSAIQALWNREVRGLMRLQSYPGASELFVKLRDLDSDDTYFFAILDGGRRQVLADVLQNRSRYNWLLNLPEVSRRRPLWEGLLRIAEALAILHREGIRYLIDRLDIVAPKATELMQSTLNPNDPDQVKIKELIDMLTFENKDDAHHRRRLLELADYRNYFRFSIDICDPEQSYRRISDLEQRRGKASGGQKFVPFYICLGVAAASAYFNHLGGSRDPPPQSALLLMDEAFEKLDPENIYKIIQFYHSLGLQLIMAAPKTHQALYQETFDTLISIIRVGRAIQATPQHFHHDAHMLLRKENPMHQPRSFFEERVIEERRHAAE